MAVIFSDNFVGVGTVRGHAPQVGRAGSTWSGPTFGSPPAATLSASGLVPTLDEYGDYAGRCEFNDSSPSMNDSESSPDVTVEVVIRMSALSAGKDFRISLNVLGANFTVWVSPPYAGEGSVYLVGEIGWVPTSPKSQLVRFPGSGFFDTDHTLMLTLSSGACAAIIFDQVVAITPIVGSTLAGLTLISMELPPDTIVKSLIVNGAAWPTEEPPVDPVDGDFWTQIVGCEET